MSSNKRIGIIAGEVSGDLLGAALIHSLRKLNPDLQFEGIGGPQMIAAGCKTLVPMEKLSVMGISAVLARLPELLSIRRNISNHFLQNPPDIFIGIDAPDFNLTVEEKLKKAGIKTVHYVSPTVWAWRRGRLKKIARAVDLMLTLFPYEMDFYRAHSAIPAEFIGHPMADAIPFAIDQTKARTDLGLPVNKKIMAILPGSRSNEIHYLGELFINTALWCRQRVPDLQFVAPMVNAERKQQFAALLQQLAPQLDIKLVDGRSQEVMAAADLILLASGTATLQSMLFKKPMVVAYRMSMLNYAIAKCLISKTYIALPNLLAKKELVPEFIQGRATVKNLGNALLDYLQNSNKVENLQAEFLRIHQSLRCNASDVAAKLIVARMER